MAKKKVKKTIQPKPVKIPNGLKPLRELALHSPYTMGYLSLMARRKQLKVRKIGRVWFSSTADIKEFEEKMKRQKEERNERLRSSYLEKAEKVKISVMNNQRANKILKEVQTQNQEVGEKPLNSAVAGDTIFDEVQRELGGILNEIRDKERKLRHDYLVHRGGDILDQGGETDLAREKQLTENLSNRLIDNMGRLLRTANDIHNHNEKIITKKGRREFDIDNLTEDNDHLLGNYHKDNFLSVPYSYFPFEDSGRLARQRSVSLQNKILLFVAGILVFVAALLTILILFG